MTSSAVTKLFNWCIPQVFSAIGDVCNLPKIKAKKMGVNYNNSKMLTFFLIYCALGKGLVLSRLISSV